MTTDAGPEPRARAIRFMANNTVAANMLMVLLLASGLLIIPSLAQEVFPEITLDQVIVTVPYPGATPEDVERGVVLAVEEAARGVDGVDEVRSSASEGLAVVSAEIESGADVNRMRDEIESAVGRITSLPADAERPTIAVGTNRREVLSLIVYGDVDRDALRHASETIRSDLLRDERITQVEISGLPPQEIVIEIPEATLREHGLTLTEVAERVGRASVDVPGGTVRSPSRQARLRVHERRELAKEYGEIAVVAGQDGSELTVSDLGTVTDGFRETDQRAWYDGDPAARLRVFQVGDQTPLDVSDAAHAYLETNPLPESLGAAVYNDSSEIYRGRIALLLDNGYLGVALVIGILGHEVRVYVKNPEGERQSLHELESRVVMTPGGGEMPLRQAARVERVRAPVTIDRVQGRRVVTVTADVDDAITTGTELAATVTEGPLAALAERYPGLSYGLAGGEEDRQESIDALKRNLSVAMVAMLVLLAVVFRSYTQPVLILIAVPFGLVGALGGHLLLGFDISIISMLGMVALAGVVVNDSLVLIDAANRYRREGEHPFDAITHAAERRFRPILLTSLTTFFGLAPLIFERSIQARFLIPMAVSLGFGVLFVTVIALVIVPAGYMVLEDIRRLRSR